MAQNTVSHATKQFKSAHRKLADAKMELTANESLFSQSASTAAATADVKTAAATTTCNAGALRSDGVTSQSAHARPASISCGSAAAAAHAQAAFSEIQEAHEKAQRAYAPECVRYRRRIPPLSVESQRVLHATAPTNAKQAASIDHNAQMSLRSWFVIGSEFREMLASQKEDREQLQLLHSKIEQLHELDRKSFDIMSRSQTGLCVLVEELQKRLHKLEQQAIIQSNHVKPRHLCHRCKFHAAPEPLARDACTQLPLDNSTHDLP